MSSMFASRVAACVALKSIAKRSASAASFSLRSHSTGTERSYLSGLNLRRTRRMLSPTEEPREDTNISTTGAYESPLHDLFDRMHSDGPTALGTTDKDLQLEIEMAKNEKLLQCGIPERVLRFTATSLGRTLVAPHVHPNEHRVVLKINTRNLQLSSTEMEILKEIVGNRLNHEREELRLSSNQFGSRIENKRHLVSMLDRIVMSCRRLGSDLKPDKEHDLN